MTLDSRLKPASQFSQYHLSRRGLFRATTGLVGASLLATGMRTPSRTFAQGLTGNISVGYDSSATAIVALVEAAAAGLKAANPGVEIELKPAPGGNWETQLFLQLRQGTAPDVFVVTGLGIAELGAAGYIEPLDPYLASWDGWAQYSDPVRKAIAFQDKFWALPTSIDTHFLYYRKDLFEQAGLPRDWQPKVPDDVLAAARQIKEALPDIIPYGLYAGANGGNSTAVRGFLPLLYAFGGALTDESGRWIIDSPALRSTLGYYQSAYQVDKSVPQDVMTAVNPTSMLRTGFATGGVAMLYDGSWVYGGWDKAVPQVAQEQTGFPLFPSADGASTFAVGGVGNSWYINAKSGAKDLAWALLVAGNSADALAMLNAADPHIPPRTDSAANPIFQSSPFLTAMVDSVNHLVTAPPDPAYRQLIAVIQNATGLVATGEATPEEALRHYADELTRILGEDRVVSQA